MSINATLEELGNLSVEEIACFFESINIRGTKDDPCLCPLARYLGMKLDNNHISVGSHSVINYFGSRGRNEVFIMPKVLREFINRFDAGEFPELEYAR